MAPQLTPVQRRQIVALREAGHNIKEIERQTGITRKSVRFWILRNEETGGDLSPYHRQNYTRATTADQDAAIKMAHQEQPFVKAKTIASQYHISTRTVRRRLKEPDLRHCIHENRNLLTNEHAQARDKSLPHVETAMFKMEQDTRLCGTSFEVPIKEEFPDQHQKEDESVPHLKTPTFKMEQDTRLCGTSFEVPIKQEFPDQYQKEDKSLLHLETATFKMEQGTRSCGASFEVPIKQEFSGENTVETAISELYVDHKIKEELAVGPTVVQHPEVKEPPAPVLEQHPVPVEGLQWLPIPDFYCDGVRELGVSTEYAVEARHKYRVDGHLHKTAIRADFRSKITLKPNLERHTQIHTGQNYTNSK